MRTLQLQEATVHPEGDPDLDETAASKGIVVRKTSSSVAFSGVFSSRRAPLHLSQTPRLTEYEPLALLAVPPLRRLWVAVGEDFRSGELQLRVISRLSQTARAASAGASGGGHGDEMEAALYVAEEEVESLTRFPLKELAEASIDHVSRVARGLPQLTAALPFDVSRHPQADTHVAKVTHALTAARARTGTMIGAHASTGIGAHTGTITHTCTGAGIRTGCHTCSLHLAAHGRPMVGPWPAR